MKKNVDTLNVLIRAFCADYERRRGIILGGSASRRVDNELKYYNFKIYDAAAEICGEDLAEIFVNDIGFERGYAGSKAEYISESTYKRLKPLIVENIAAKLYLK